MQPPQQQQGLYVAAFLFLFFVSVSFFHFFSRIIKKNAVSGEWEGDWGNSVNVLSLTPILSHGAGM
jgi:hypothetical protein